MNSGLAMAVAACAPRTPAAADEPIADIAYEPFAAEFGDVVDRTSQARLLSTGHWWAEGPAWDRERQTLYFTDVPRNVAYSWSAADGDQTFLSPSGARPEDAEGMREPGANGLLLACDGRLLICNHGKRAIEARDLDTGQSRILVDRFEGQRFNSPNDIVEAGDGVIYFTDPPYGLEGLNDSPLKQMSVNGVYRLLPSGAVTRVVDDMSFPNGVVLSPDERWLYVSQSDPDAPLVRRFDLMSDGGIGEGEIWFDAQPFMHEVGGLPDGMAVAQSGHVFLAGPGGVLVIDPAGQCLGRIFTSRPSANCAFGEDGRTLFITAQDRVVAVRIQVAGLGRF